MNKVINASNRLNFQTEIGPLTQKRNQLIEVIIPHQRRSDNEINLVYQTRGVNMLTQIINLLPSERSEMSIEIFRIQVRFVVLISFHIVDPLRMPHEVNSFAAM